MAALRSVARLLPERTRGIRIVVHCSQDGDGMFGVMVHLDGPDLHVLNKAIAVVRSLVEVRLVKGRLVPDVPTFDTLDPAFGVNDAIVDTVMVWLR